MSQLLHTLPQAIADRLKPLMPKIRECKGIAGRFNLERLQKESINTPALLVSVLELKQTTPAAGPVHFFDLSMAAFIVTKDQLGLSRDEAGANIAAALCAYVPDKRWGEPACGEARNVRGQSIVTAGFLKTSASLWAVTWTQPCTFATIPKPEAMGVELYLGHVPEIGAAHTDDYERIGEIPDVV
jgi:hypothetical protein